MNREEYYNEIIIPLSQKQIDSPNEVKVMLITNHPQYIQDNVYAHYLSLKEHCEDVEDNCEFDMEIKYTKGDITIITKHKKTGHTCRLIYLIREEMVRQFRGMRVDMSYVANEYWEMRLIIMNIHKIIAKLGEDNER